MNPQDLLSQLRDLDAPAAIGWWPLAPGWWILIFLVLCAISLTIIFTVSKYRREAIYRAATAEIKTLHQNYLDNAQQAQALTQLLQSANAILKRLACHIDDTAQVSSLTGKSWHRYLSNIAGDQCNATELAPFETALYQSNPQIDVDEFIGTLTILVEQMSVYARSAPKTRHLKTSVEVPQRA